LEARDSGKSAVLPPWCTVEYIGHSPSPAPNASLGWDNAPLRLLVVEPSEQYWHGVSTDSPNGVSSLERSLKLGREFKLRAGPGVPVLLDPREEWAAIVGWLVGPDERYQERSRDQRQSAERYCSRTHGVSVEVPAD
jgi:hypothetical protein